MNIYEAAKVEWFEKCAEIYLEKIALGTTAAPGGLCLGWADYLRENLPPH